MRIKDVPLRKLPQNLFISLGSHVELSSSSSPIVSEMDLNPIKNTQKAVQKPLGSHHSINNFLFLDIFEKRDRENNRIREIKR